jgi:hypothetical protein
VKRINDRQWWHRLTHRKCWNCNVPLTLSLYRDGRECSMCHRFYSETVMVAWERKGRPA